MSDKVITYRSRDEIKHGRYYRDPIGLVKIKNVKLEMLLYSHLKILILNFIKMSFSIDTSYNFFLKFEDDDSDLNERI